MSYKGSNLNELCFGRYIIRTNTDRCLNGIVQFEQKKQKRDRVIGKKGYRLVAILLA